MELLLLALMTALIGSLHCVGMCGGFPALVMQLNQGPRAWWAAVRYLAGKSMMYGILGGLAGLGGHALIQLISQGQLLVSVLAGLGFIVVGFSFLGVSRNRTSSYAGLARFMGKMLKERPGSVTALGLVNGLLPCPMVYSMLLVAASTASLGKGVLVMTVLGLGTIPALVAAGWVGRSLSPAWKRHAQRVGGIFLIVLGTLTMGRGWIEHDASHAHPLQVGQVHHQNDSAESEYHHHSHHGDRR